MTFVVIIVLECHSYLILTLWATLQGWSECVTFGDFASYRDRFEQIQAYFAPRFPEASRIGNEMIKTILQSTQTAEKAQQP